MPSASPRSRLPFTAQGHPFLCTRHCPGPPLPRRISHAPPRARRMTPHLTAKEVALVGRLAHERKSPSHIHAKIVAARARRHIAAPEMQVINRAMSGKTHRRGAAETCGRPAKLTRQNVRRLDTVRKTLYKQAKGEREIHLEEIIRKAKVPKVDPTTAARHLKAAGYDVKARPPREKPMRTKDHEELRVKICKVWSRKPASHFSSAVDLIMDNKKWDIPTSARGKRYSNMRKVRFHWRTRAEGLKPGFTKPSGKRQRLNIGSSVNVCAGIIDCQVKLWHYLPGKTWNGAVAAETYRGPIHRALRRYRGEKKSYLVLEDNDPAGYKSNAAKTAKAELGIKPLEYPTYSPDLNPMDFFLWSEVARRMEKGRAPRAETVAQYKARLRRTAFSTPKEVVKKAVESIRERAKAVVKAGGGDIPRD